MPLSLKSDSACLCCMQRGSISQETKKTSLRSIGHHGVTVTVENVWTPSWVFYWGVLSMVELAENRPWKLCRAPVGGAPVLQRVPHITGGQLFFRGNRHNSRLFCSAHRILYAHISSLLSSCFTCAVLFFVFRRNKLQFWKKLQLWKMHNLTHQ